MIGFLLVAAVLLGVSAFFFRAGLRTIHRPPAPVTPEQALLPYTGPGVLPHTEQAPAPYAPAWKAPAKTAVAGSPPWSGPHANTAVGLLTDIAMNIPGPVRDLESRRTPVPAGRAGEPSFTPSGWRPAQSWNCLMTPPRRKVRPLDDTVEFRAIGASRVPEYARLMLGCPLEQLASVVAADRAQVERMGWGLA